MDQPPFSDGMAVLYLLGAAQGLFLAAVLASRPRNALPNRLLAGLMLVFSLDLAMAVYHASGFSTAQPALIGLDQPAGFLYGPLLYLYARTLTAPRSTLRPVDLAHAVPAVLCVLLFLPFFLLSGPEKLATLRDPGLTFSTRALVVVNPLKLLHGTVYLVLLIRLLRRHRARVEATMSSVEHATLRWLRNLVGGVVLLLGASALLYALGTWGLYPVVGMDPTALYDDVTLLGVTVFVYAIGYFGLRQPALLAPPQAAAGLQGKENVRTPYARSGMSEAEAERLKEALLTLMDTEHPYRRGDLTLPELAEALGISPHNLTEVINTRLGQSFYDFVNGYRVREAQARLADPAFAHWTVLAVGLEAGFNAKSSFNAAFKRHAGMTPSQYRQRHAEAV